MVFFFWGGGVEFTLKNEQRGDSKCPDGRFLYSKTVVMTGKVMAFRKMIADGGGWSVCNFFIQDNFIDNN